VADVVTELVADSGHTVRDAVAGSVTDSGADSGIYRLPDAVKDIVIDAVSEAVVDPVADSVADPSAEAE
jgi:hypothetical protein